MAAVGLCAQEHKHPLCTPGIPNPSLPVPGYKGGSHAIQCVRFIYFSGVSEDLVTFPTRTIMIIVVIIIIIMISKLCPGHDAA